MNLSISNIAWNQKNNLSVLNILHGQGVNYIEVAPKNLFNNPLVVSEKDVELCLNFWSSNGITLCSMQSLLFNEGHLKIFLSESVRAETLKYLKKIIKLASRLKIYRVVFGNPINRSLCGTSPKSAMLIAKYFFNELADYAGIYGICICMEANASCYGTDFINTTEEAVELIDFVDHQFFRLNFDTGAIISNGGEVKYELRQYYDYIEHIHISAPELSPINKDLFSIEPFLGFLDKMKYSKYISIEMKMLSDVDDLSHIESSCNLIKKYLHY
jgi:D-psicose/D-tagatose/L-ribulose 3-epimerase